MKGRPPSLTLQQRIELRQMRGADCTLLECAVWFKTSRASISRYLAKPLPTADELRNQQPYPFRDRRTALERRIERFWSKVSNANVKGSCWLWRGYTKPSGHGLTTWSARPIHAHRLAWILKRGDPGKDLCVNHKCHNPLCCNPNHMYVGTREQNMADRWGRVRYRVKLSPAANSSSD